MKSIKERYNEFAEKNPNWSSYICFAEAIKHHRYNREKISELFKKFVDPNDYSKKESKQIIEFLVELSNSRK